MAKKRNRKSERQAPPVLTGHDGRCRERSKERDEAAKAQAPDGISGSWG